MSLVILFPQLIFFRLLLYQEILLVLDGTTGLNMLPQAREFNEVTLSLKLFFEFTCDLFVLVKFLD